MELFGINGWEILLIIVIGVVVLGPERLPDYAAKLGKLVRQTKQYADAARAQLQDQMGPEFQDVDWSKYDIRQYDPRRIVREALMDDPEAEAAAQTTDEATAGRATPEKAQTRPNRDPGLPTPFDDDAT